jgi:hypothetical protein
VTESGDPVEGVAVDVFTPIDAGPDVGLLLDPKFNLRNAGVPEVLRPSTPTGSTCSGSSTTTTAIMNPIAVDRLTPH